MKSRTIYLCTWNTTFWYFDPPNKSVAKGGWLVFLNGNGRQRRIVHKSPTDKLRILASKDLEFYRWRRNMIAGIKSRHLKMILKKLRSYDFDTSEEKRLCQIYEFLLSAPVENSIKNHQLFQNILISNFMFTPLEPSLNSQTF